MHMICWSGGSKHSQANARNLLRVGRQAKGTTRAQQHNLITLLILPFLCLSLRDGVNRRAWSRTSATR